MSSPISAVTDAKGKSTLLRILMGKEEPDEGSAQFLGQNVFPSYFEQNQADVLDLDMTVVDTVQAASNTQSYNELRALLGQFLFKGDAVEKKIENLSGGEKARLSLCCMMLKESNLLVSIPAEVTILNLDFFSHLKLSDFGRADKPPRYSSVSDNLKFLLVACFLYLFQEGDAGGGSTAL